MNKDRSAFLHEMQDELDAILNYWAFNCIDEEQGGFFGKVDNDNHPDKTAVKGLVLNARILWTFAAAYPRSGKKLHIQIAERAFRYLLNHFKDPEYGGLYWSVDAGGHKADTRKQIYGIAFGIYGLSEYYEKTNEPEALQLAIELYELIEKHSHDPLFGGYIEAFEENWGFLSDKRLSAKDANAKKSANTHLHILEAYATLYRVWPGEQLKNRILELLDLFIKKIINTRTFHLDLFFSEDWSIEPSVISYGHDVEAGWLLLACAETINDPERTEKMKALALQLSNAAMQGIDEDGGIWYEYDVVEQKLIQEKHWWPQAEALIGFFNAWEISKEEKYLNAALKNWAFIKKYILDKKKGEWFWGIHADHSIMENEDKAGFWKCPYHNSRAFLEILGRSA